jgi:hypothetical protein
MLCNKACINLLNEIALVHFVTDVYVIRIHYDEIPKYALTEILEKYPHNDFKNAFIALVTKQAEIKPKSHIATHMNVGFGKKAKQTLFID